MIKPISSTGLAKAIRLDVLDMVSSANASHIGSCYSMADILAVLYSKVLSLDHHNADYELRDRFILSKGHAAAAVYSCLANVGLIDKGDLLTYGVNGSQYMTHVSHKINGVEFSSGSLGHGLPFAVGKAIAAKKMGLTWRVFVILSDGEMDEGSNWEALMFSAHHKLDNLVAIVDYNKLQSLTTIAETLGLEPLRDKIEAFGWNVVEVDGHDHDALIKQFAQIDSVCDKPSLVIAHTVKGKGVSFMENKVAWHYRSPQNDDYQLAKNELESADA